MRCRDSEVCDDLYFRVVQNDVDTSPRWQSELRRLRRRAFGDDVADREQLQIGKLEKFRRYSSLIVPAPITPTPTAPSTVDLLGSNTTE